MKEILDHLINLAKSYSDTGSSTSSPYVDTFYTYSTSFWLCCSSFILSLVLLALFLVMSKSADKLGEEAKDNPKADQYSISTIDTIDFGPRVNQNRRTSDVSSTFRFNNSIHNLTGRQDSFVVTPTLDRQDSFAAPPTGQDSKAVRFS
jgi:hypothetical protein